jgi:hypothetical protein
VLAIEPASAPRAERMNPFRPPSGPLIQNAREYAGLPTAEMTPMPQFIMSPCEKKCDADYEADAIVCGKVADEAERKKCNERARASYTSCRDNCQQKDNGDCLERCKELCDQILDKCTEDCKKDPNPRVCRSRCMDAYSKCLKECDRKCKGK